MLEKPACQKWDRQKDPSFHKGIVWVLGKQHQVLLRVLCPCKYPVVLLFLPHILSWLGWFCQSFPWAPDFQWSSHWWVMDTQPDQHHGNRTAWNIPDRKNFNHNRCWSYDPFKRPCSSCDQSKLQLLRETLLESQQASGNPTWATNVLTQACDWWS